MNKLLFQVKGFNLTIFSFNLYKVIHLNLMHKNKMLRILKITYLKYKVI